MKALIIGLDGSTWDVLDDFLLRNYMPNLKKLKDNGCSGVLQSTEPPITSTAWTTFLTGCNPNVHGILSFREYSAKNNSIYILNSTHCRVPNMWQELSRQGYKVASINVPWTYPCQEVNGIVVAGFGCPGPQSQFTFPSSFKDELLAEIPDYDVKAEFDWTIKDSLEKFNENIKRVERSFQQRFEAARLVSKKINWDIMMVQFHDTDTIHHHVWSYVGKDSRDRYRQQRDRLFEMFEKLDKTIGRLLDLSTAEDLLVIVVSDHGGGRLIGAIRPNILLYQWGYLKVTSPLTRMTNRFIRRCQRRVNLIIYGLKRKERIGIRQTKESNINWRRSTAAILHTASTHGYMHINLKQLQENHTRFGAEYDIIIKNLKRRFSEIKDPVTGKPLFYRVATPAELYGPNNTIPESVGDLIFIPQAGFEVRTSMSKRKGYLTYTPDESPEGTHSYEGIYIFSGPGVKTLSGNQVNIVDMAPTIYAALGAKLPSYLDGKVLNEVFTKDLEVWYQSSERQEFQRSPQQQELSAKEQELIAQRLSELGYLD
jgi:predicted AlkP superfamily phosphohydrolase/phosphomutase